MTSVDGRMVDLANRQHGLVQRAQLRKAGITSKVLGRLERDGVLCAVTPQVFSLGTGPLDHEQRYRIALWQAGDRAVLSHAAAAVRWEFPRLQQGAVEVVIPHGTTVPAHTIGRVHVSRCLEAADVVLHLGLRTTTPRRTVIDLARRLGRTHLTDVLQDLRRRSLLEVDALAAELGLGSHRGIAGIVRLERLVDSLVSLPVGESWLEDEFIALLQRGGQRLPETQVEIVVDGRRYRVDNLWRPERLVVELDGHQFHSQRADRNRDAERIARITSAGYRVVTFTYDHVVERSDYVLATVDLHLTQRRGAAAA